MGFSAQLHVFAKQLSSRIASAGVAVCLAAPLHVPHRRRHSCLPGCFADCSGCCGCVRDAQRGGAQMRNASRLVDALCAGDALALGWEREHPLLHLGAVRAVPLVRVVAACLCAPLGALRDAWGLLWFEYLAAWLAPLLMRPTRPDDYERLEEEYDDQGFGGGAFAA